MRKRIVENIPFLPFEEMKNKPPKKAEASQLPKVEAPPSPKGETLLQKERKETAKGHQKGALLNLD